MPAVRGREKIIMEEIAKVWYNPNLYSWIPGTVFGILGGLYGAMVGLWASRGKARKPIMAMHYMFIAISVLMSGVAVAAYFSHQPFGIWYGWGLPGIFGVFLFSSMTPMLRNSYRRAEMQKSLSQDL
jgi:hypothetical protein